MTDTQTMTAMLKRLSWFAACAITLIAATVAFVFALQRRARDDLADTREFARIARSVAALATDRETAIRGFLLTRDQKSLLRDAIGRAELPRLLDSLEMMATRDRTQVGRVRAATAALAHWDNLFAKPAVSGELTTRFAALAGKPLFDVVRSHFEVMISEGDARFVEQRAHARKVEVIGLAVVLGELILFFALLVYMIRGRLRGQADDLDRQQEMLEQQAIELELQMDETALVNQSLLKSLLDAEQKDEELIASIEQRELALERECRSEERYRYVEGDQ